MTEEQKRQIKEKEREQEEQREREKRLIRFEKYRTLAVFRYHEPIIRFAGELTRSFRFQMFMILIICIAGVLVGINTYNVQNTAVRHAVMVCELIVVIIFILEIQTLLLNMITNIIRFVKKMIYNIIFLVLYQNLSSYLRGNIKLRYIY